MSRVSRCHDAVSHGVTRDTWLPPSSLVNPDQVRGEVEDSFIRSDLVLDDDINPSDQLQELVEVSTRALDVDKINCIATPVTCY